MHMGFAGRLGWPSLGVGGRRTITRACAFVVAALAVTLLVAPAASAFVIGPGSRPGLAVDAAGTAYVAWNGPEITNSTLRFCRLPRGATACDSSSVLPAPATTTSLSRPFVVVSGDRVSVVQFRYPTSGGLPPGMYRFTSTNRGVSFGAPQVIGSVAFEEAAVGPGDTLSGVPVNAGMYFQNVALSGAAPVNMDGSSAVPKALLSTTHLNQATVGLLDAGTPLAVFTSNDSAQFRRYDGSGPLNDIANWTPPVDIGIASYPKLAGGPRGLFLLAGNGNASLFARKWNGSGFGPPVTIGPGSSPEKHLFQDAGGRLHAVFQRDSANPLQVIHAVSDDGVTWRQGTAARQDIASSGGISGLRVATAPDHIGVTVWHAGTGAGDVRVTPVGPDAPRSAPPPAADVVSFTTAPKSLRVSKTGRFTYKFLATPLRSGKVGLKSTKKVKIGSKKRFVKLAAKKFTSPTSAKVKVKFKLSKKNLKALKKKHKIRFKVTATLTGKTFTTKLTLKAPKKR
jgi:hypothetical protein